MKNVWIAGASALALAATSAPASAQIKMPGMTMPMPAKKALPKKHSAKVHALKKTPAKQLAAKKASSSRAAPTRVDGAANGRETSMQRGGLSMTMPAQLQSQSGSTLPVGQSQMRQGTMDMPSRGQTSGGTPMRDPHKTEAPMSAMSMGDRSDSMSATGAYGSYPAQRESSGTAWQPDTTSSTSGPMLMSGDWMLMAHGTLNLVYDHQSGPRGDHKAFASGMLMGMARRPLGNGTLQLRAMLSPDPIMGPAGYPLLLATGETANGRTPLVDRQHPHDFFMELSASVSQTIGMRSSIFLYGGLPGEPAFGPPAFMHRESILDSPEAPITHHWLDSTHITFGVVTAGLVLDRLKIEVSQFNAREPDQRRWNIETGPLDSTSVRLSWNPARTLALQGSWGHFKDPEQLEPGVDQTRWSASALWAHDVALGWHAAAALAWGRKSSNQHSDDGIAAEASIKHAHWTVFGRGEWIENGELLGLVHSPAYKVAKVSLGAVRDLRIAEHLSLGAGGLLSVNFVPGAIAPLYGGRNPIGAMAFVRLKLD